jgi:hypothetical protein
VNVFIFIKILLNEGYEMIKGIQYIIDEQGKKKSVILDLEKWGDYWEDFYDILVSESRRGESTISWEKLKKETASSQ